MKEKEIINHLTNSLISSGYRMTYPRSLIIEVISSMEKPLTPMEIFERTKSVNPDVGLMTIYRAIEILSSIGLLDRVHNVHGCEAVFLSPSTHQHLLLCSSCSTAVYFDGLEVENAFNKVGEKFNFNITNHWLQLEGVCSNCRN